MNLNIRAKAEPEVNMTSLIDVVLLLLIFFMVSTSFVKQSQISIRLPQADSAAVVDEVPQQLDVMITEQGTFLVNGRELVNNRPETIRNALEKVSNGNTTLPLTIKADVLAILRSCETAMELTFSLSYHRNTNRQGSAGQRYM